MRIVVDGATAGNNSIGVCLEGWLRGWPAASSHPPDELHVVVSREFADQAGLAAMPYVTVHGFGAGIRERAKAQHLVVPRLVSQRRADALLCAVPQIPFLARRVPIVIVAHDFRHDLLPEEFSRRRRALRAVEYSRAYRRADRIATVSERTRSDLGRLYPKWGAKSAAIHLGSDRPTRAACGRAAGEPVAIAYATHVNKRPDLVMRAWAITAGCGNHVPALAIVGAPPTLCAELVALRDALGLAASQVSVHPFLADEEYAALMARARMVVLASTFEGFGLPVVEALRLGVPVVITPEPAMMEVGGPAVTVAADDSPEAVAAAVVAALAGDTVAARQAGIEWAAQFSWEASAMALRAELARAVAGRSSLHAYRNRRTRR